MLGSNMKTKDLVDAGYKKFTAYLKSADAGYQKRFYSETGTRYFINVMWYDWSAGGSLNIPYYEGFEVDCQFMDEDDNAINILFSCTNMTVEELENKIEYIFTTLNFKDYE